jgi:carbamoyl-phosphate synthase large subunit
LSSGGGLPNSGKAFVSVADHDKRNISMPCKKMVDMGFTLYTTSGTAAVLKKNGIKSIEIGKLFQKEQSVLDLIKKGKINLIMNVPQTQYEAQDDSYKIRTTAIANNIPVLTTSQQFISAVQAIEIAKKVDVIKPEKL